MKIIFYTLLLLIGILLPTSSASAFIDIAWESPSNDQSIFYLGVLFGPVGAALPEATGGPLLGQIFSIFNIGVLTIGSILVLYTVFVSTINTAQEGEVMGKKWSSIWIPIRAAGGIAMLLPTGTGFSLIQIMMMGLIVNGVHAANAIWNVVLQSVTITGGLGEEAPEVSGADEATQGMFKSLICKHLLNEQYTDALGQPVTEYERSNAIVIGAEGMEHNEEICGGLEATSAPEGYDEDDWKEQQLNAASDLASTLDSYALEAAMSDKSDWTGSDVINQGKTTLTSALNLLEPDATADDFDETMGRALEDGWIFAGSYYYQLLNPPDASGGFSKGKPKAPKVIDPDYSQLPFTKSVLDAKYTAYLEYTDLRTDDPDTPRQEIDLGPAGNLSGEIARVWDDAGLTDFFIDMATGIIDTLSNDNENPIITLQRFGANIMMTVEVSWLATIGVIFLVALIGCVMEAFLPICWAMGAALAVLVPIVTLFFVLLWSAGVAIGLYLPLVPFILFTFSALSWLILVVEAMVAAPIVALGLVAPSGDHLGKASPAVVLVLNVFLRPSLIVIGFIAGAQLVVVLMRMINFGFVGTIQASLTGVGLFGAVAIVVLYAGIAIIAVHESFSLIHIIPDKVIRWIGGHVQDSMVGRAAKEAEDWSQTAASKSGEAMKSVASFGKGVNTMIDDADKNNSTGLVGNTAAFLKQFKDTKKGAQNTADLGEASMDVTSSREPNTDDNILPNDPNSGASTNPNNSPNSTTNTTTTANTGGGTNPGTGGTNNPN
ncbi:MAG: DotA/TraY family protein [Gammaproteobacteria bacterium]